MTIETLGAKSALVTAAPEQAWEKLLTRLNILEATGPDGLSDDAYEALIDEAGDLASVLMAMPAPSAAALRWKLDHLLGRPEAKDTHCHGEDFLSQTITDYRRMLGDRVAGMESNTGALLAFAQSAAWDMAVQRVADAKSAHDAFYDREVRPLCTAHEKGGELMDQISVAEDAAAVFDTVLYDAVKGLIATKTPTLSGLALKIEAAHGELMFAGCHADEVVTAVMADLRGLSGEA